MRRTHHLLFTLAGGLLASGLSQAACSSTPVLQQADSATIQAWVQGQQRQVLSFTGYSGAGYDDEAAMLALAARVLYSELIRGGVRIHEYLPAFLHAKVMVVDNRWATIGSSNIDPLSLLLNLESNLIVRDEAFATGLRREVETAMQQSHEVLREEVLHERSWVRLLRRAVVAWCAYVYLRLAGVTGRY